MACRGEGGAVLLASVSGSPLTKRGVRLASGRSRETPSRKRQLIYAVRLALVRAQGANLMDRYGHQSLVVPMIPVHYPDNTPHEAGMVKL